ncbi:hypothetical protein jhhlp_003796 [Lomentospora prolificans]|uniref:EGF-like domain-containing protein n=1 Tax=Lomentospora prolificans TaxID=41688 RepID=A0A2N3N9Y4_9PEZI|nr:hypothetical protein jhhlp_003796 [Lomentospora prolificans]
MDRTDASGGSVRRERERAENVRTEDRLAGATSQRHAMPLALQGKNVPIGVAISRPTPVPQWPLPGPIPTPAVAAGSEPYQPPPGRSQPPKRPPRPSRVPSILDASRVQDPTPVFQYQPQNARDSEQSFNSSVPPTPSSFQTNSSTASIPDFPLPVSAAPPGVPPGRRSVTLGPPPSARRGASSFYSNVSFVSPIPEESPRTRSHTSLASSAAIPESFGSPSPGNSPTYPDAFYDEILRANGHDSNSLASDESKLVRSASIGKRGKPHLVMNKGTASSATPPRPGPAPIQDPFADGTGYLEASSSETTATAAKSDSPPNGLLVGPTDATQARTLSPSPPRMAYNRLSAIRRPPKLDMEAVERANARGSMTSLPDLIKRATRLAAMIDRGKRPASRFDDLEFPDEKAGRNSDRSSTADDRHQSGFSDMLAAFPPPAQATSRTSRVGSWFKAPSSWPLPPSINRGQASQQASAANVPTSKKASPPQNNRKRYCGLPLWGFIIIVIVVLGIIAAAVLVPLQFFVFRNLGGPLGDSTLAQCREQLTCENGGTNVVARDVCSCICTNGFTGSNCTIAGSAGCTTTSLATLDETPGIDNVTLGQAIPRLISEAQGNFSVPLSGTEILARFNTGSLSCTAQNSLVTFDGRSARNGETQAAVVGAAVVDDEAAVVGAAFFVAVEIITIVPNQLNAASDSSIAGFQTIPRVTTISRTMINTLPNRIPGTTTTTVTTTLPATATAMPESTAFVVSEDVLDFARVAVLFVLQEDGLSDASRAQSILQRFFTTSGTVNGRGSSLTTDQASNIDLGNGNTVDLVNFRVNTGSGSTGGRTFKRALELEEMEARPRVVPRRWLDLSLEIP